MDEPLEGNSNVNWRDFWTIATTRRRWSLLGPFFLLGLLGFGVALIWPNKYRSEALIIVQQQTVPEQYVTPNVVTNLQDRLQSMTQQILSRTRLQALIERFNLYPRERARMTTDDLIDQMREDISIEPIKAATRQGDVTAFRISYTTESPSVAQQVTNELISLFINENLQNRTELSVSTTSFLASQLEQARKDLAEQEERLRQYKMRFLGELPEQQQSNLQILSSLEVQLHAAVNALDRAEQEKTYLESMRAEYQALQRSQEDQDSSLSISSGSPGTVALNDLRRRLTELESKYTPQHPDVVSLKEQIAELEASEARLKPGRSEKQEGKAGTVLGTQAERLRLPEIESRLRAVALEIENQRKQSDDLSRRIGQIQSRLNLTPEREQQLAEVRRNYENSRENYQSLLQKRLQSELATNLEKRQQGEQFRIIDPASLPQKPVEPNRAQIILIGWVLGLCGGVGFPVLREITDGTLRTERDVNRWTEIPVLMSLPILKSRGDEIRGRRRRLLEIVAVAVLVLMSVGTGVYAYLVS